MWNLIGLVFWTVIFVYVITKISNIYDLLSGVSDDIYDIKKKLGLGTELRTKKQHDKLRQCQIRDMVYDGKDSEELKKTLGASEFLEYKWWIDLLLKEYSNMKICPKCDILYSIPVWKECKFCKMQLVSTMEHKPRQHTMELSKVEAELKED